MIESTKYEVKGNQVNFFKHLAGAPCEVGAKSSFPFEITANNLTIEAVTDECAARTKSLKSEIYTK